MRSLIKIVFFAFILVFAISCDSQWDNHIEVNELRGKTLMQVLSEDSQTSTFAAILQKTGYDQLLQGDKMLTVFAPVNSVLANVDQNNLPALKELVRNHIAYAAYTIEKGSFLTDTIVMLNTKKAIADGMKINGNEIVADGFNLSVRNGILHKMNGVIEVRKNIWEYLQSQSGNLQMEFIKKHDRLIMDMEKSIQIGVDAKTGKPLYDTVWLHVNPFLNAYPLHKESANYSYALLPNSVVQRIETKYSKYFNKANALVKDSIVRVEMIKDCILKPVKIDADGRFLSVDGVLMNINKNDIASVYQASNGTVYVLNDADVKIYENKIKTIHIEGEQYANLFSNNSNSWMLRSRQGLSNGLDLCLNSPTVFNTTYKYVNPDTTINVAISRTFYPNSSSNVGNVNNCYAEYRPVMNSVAYKVYWSAYNDYSSHILPVTLSVNNGKTTEMVSTVVTCKFSQKLLFSMPDKPMLTRNPSTGTLTNNFDANTVWTSTRFTAGVREEKQLFRAQVSADAANVGFSMPLINTTSTGESDFFSAFAGNDAFGDKDAMIVPNYGVATIWVANTTERKASNPGMIFIDYIKLVPVVDPNE